MERLLLALLVVAALPPATASAGTNPFTTQIAYAPLPRAKIAPDGSFVSAGVVSKHASFVHGRIQGRRAKGKASLSLGVCSGSASFKAKRK